MPLFWYPKPAGRPRAANSDQIQERTPNIFEILSRSPASRKLGHSSGLFVDSYFIICDPNKWQQVPENCKKYGDLLSAIFALPTGLQVTIIEQLPPSLAVALLRNVAELRWSIDERYASIWKMLSLRYRHVELLYGIQADRDVNRFLGMKWMKRAMLPRERVLCALEKLHNDAYLVTRLLMRSLWPNVRDNEPPEGLFDVILVMYRVLGESPMDEAPLVTARRLRLLSQMSTQRRDKIKKTLFRLGEGLALTCRPVYPTGLPVRIVEDIEESCLLAYALLPHLVHHLSQMMRATRRRETAPDEFQRCSLLQLPQYTLDMEFLVTRQARTLRFRHLGFKIQGEGFRGSRGRICLRFRLGPHLGLSVEQRKACMIKDALEHAFAYDETRYTESFWTGWRGHTWVHSQRRSYWGWSYWKVDELGLESLFGSMSV